MIGRRVGESIRHFSNLAQATSLEKGTTQVVKAGGIQVVRFENWVRLQNEFQLTEGAKTKTLQERRVEHIAPCMLHRAGYLEQERDGATYPEQSKASFEARVDAFDKEGLDQFPSIEFDVYGINHGAKELGMHVIHDRRSGRTTKGEVEMVPTTSDDCKKLRDARLKNDEPLPRLSQMLDMMVENPKVRFTSEIKTLSSLGDREKSEPDEANPEGYVKDTVEHILKQLDEHDIADLNDRIEFISFDPEIVEALKKARPSLRVLFLYDITPEDNKDEIVPFLVEWANRMDCDGLHINADMLDAKTVKFIKDNGLLCYSWPKDGKDYAEQLNAMGCPPDCVGTDYPSEYKNLQKQERKPRDSESH